MSDQRGWLFQLCNEIAADTAVLQSVHSVLSDRQRLRAELAQRDERIRELETICSKFLALHRMFGTTADFEKAMNEACDLAIAALALSEEESK